MFTRLLSRPQFTIKSDPMCIRINGKDVGTKMLSLIVDILSKAIWAIFAQHMQVVPVNVRVAVF